MLVLLDFYFFEHAGRDFCGRFVGETAPKTAAMCRDAYGSVLFIAVAYQAPRSMGFSRQEYWSGVPLLSPLPPAKCFRRVALTGAGRAGIWNSQLL